MKHGGVAQPEERPAHSRDVVGSSPTAATIIAHPHDLERKSRDVLLHLIGDATVDLVRCASRVGDRVCPIGHAYLIRGALTRA